MMALLAALALLAVPIACGPPLSAPTPTVFSPPPTEAPTPVPTQATMTAQSTQAVAGSGDLIQAWLEAVSITNLMDTVFTLSSLHTRHVNSPTIHEAAQIIYGSFVSAGGNLQVATDEFALTWNGITSTQQNVIATLPGTDPTAGIVLIGAHYDSRTVDLNDAISPAPGADDNASGVAVVLELARVLAAETPRATIVFAAFSAEEVGRVGSKHYAEIAQARGDDIRAVIVLDIVGNSAGPIGEDSVRVFRDDSPDSPSRELALLLEQQGEDWVPDMDVQVQPTIDRPGRYSDHMSFSETGVAAMRLIEPIEDTGRQHSAFDTSDAVSGNYLRSITQIVLAALDALAW